MSKFQENEGPYDGLTVNNSALLLIDHPELIKDQVKHGSY